MTGIAITHNKVTGAAANPLVLVDGPAWDDEHNIQGLSDVLASIGGLLVAPAGSPAAAYAKYVCDGTADDVEINAAINEAAASGKTVTLWAGSYSLNLPVIMQSGVALSAVSKYAATLLASAAFTTSSGMIHCGGINNYSIKKLALDGRTNNKSTNGIVSAPALLFTTGALTGTPCSFYEVSECDVQVAKLHAYHIWNVRSQDFVVANNSVNGGYTSADTFTSTSSQQEGIECLGTKRGHVHDNHIVGVGNSALNFPSFTDLSVDMGFEDMIVESNICKTVGTGILSYLYSNSVTGEVGGMKRCRFLGNTVDDWYVNGIDIEILDADGFGDPVPFQGNIISHNIAKGADAGQPSNARAFALSNQRALTDIVSTSNTVTENTFINCLNTNSAGYANIVSFSGVDFSRNTVRSPAQASGNSTAFFGFGCSDIRVDSNRFDGGRNQSILIQGCVAFSICNNTCMNWNVSGSGFVGIQVQVGTVASVGGDVQGNRFEAATLTSISAMVRFDATTDQINYLRPDNRYIGGAYTGTVVNNLSSGTFNRGVAIAKADVGLGSVDNTADASKPVSTAQAAAIALKAPIASPAFTGPASATGGFVVSAAFTAAASLTSTMNANINNGANAALPVGTGLFMVAENTTTGNWALLTIGGGGAAPTIIFQSSAGFYTIGTTPAAGHVGVAFDGTSLFRVYNNIGAAKNFSGLTIICRASN